MSACATPCTSTAYYGYDRSGRSRYEEITAEYDAAGTRQARYTQGPDVDEPVGMLRGGSYYSYQHDALGSVTRLTDASQTPVNTYRYDAWGRAMTESEAQPNPFRFTGREKDSGTALHYYRARTYDPDTGRFIGKDPAGMAGGTNLYAYVGGSPLRRTDPSGMRFSENDPFENPNRRGSGPTCPPGSNGQGNAYGHCGGRPGPVQGLGGANCGLEWAVFGIGLALGLIGFGVAASRVRNFAGTVVRGIVAGAAAGSSLALSIGNLMRSGLTLGSFGDILNIAWIVIEQLILPMLDWIGLISLTAQAVARLAPAFAAITFGVLLFSSVFGALQLKSMGC